MARRKFASLSAGKWPGQAGVAGAEVGVGAEAEIVDTPALEAPMDSHGPLQSKG